MNAEETWLRELLAAQRAVDWRRLDADLRVGPSGAHRWALWSIDARSWLHVHPAGGPWPEVLPGEVVRDLDFESTWRWSWPEPRECGPGITLHVEESWRRLYLDADDPPPGPEDLVCLVAEALQEFCIDEESHGWPEYHDEAGHFVGMLWPEAAAGRAVWTLDGRAICAVGRLEEVAKHIR